MAVSAAQHLNGLANTKSARRTWVVFGGSGGLMVVDEAEFIVFRLSAAHNLAGVPMCRAERRASGLHDLSHCRPVWLLFSWLAGVAAFSTTS